MEADIILIGNEILIICENEELNCEHILQIISKARELADNEGMKVAALCIGKYNENQYNILIQYGVDCVIVCEKKGNLCLDNICNITEAVIYQRSPKLIVYPASSYGKAISARLSARLDMGLTADCIDIEVMNNNEFIVSRAAINDSIIAKIKYINCNTGMCTVKKDVFKKWNINLSAGHIEKFIYDEYENEKSDCFYNILEKIQYNIKPVVDIGMFSIVFCIGRGVKSEKTLNKIFNLAKKYNAGIVGTRAAVELNLIEKSCQVGQSGKSISPYMYIGFGVSGASQHIVGIKNANIIIAINNNKNAPIFEYADYSIIENIEDIIKEMEKLS